MMTNTYWNPHEESENRDLTSGQIQHLHRRLAFDATEEELARDDNDELERYLKRFLHPPHRSIGGQFTVTEARRLARQAIDGNNIRLLKAAWVMEMWHGPDPLTEQLCLMWHNHFATSFLKVKDCDAMYRQNQTFRKYGRESFIELLTEMLEDRALLVWLDADTNRVDHPNENLARELLELFTLGIGNYTERDVKESARALTGWRVDNDDIRFLPSEHDPRAKTILGVTAAHDKESLVRLLVDHPATARRLAWRLCDHFIGDAIPRRAIDELAHCLRRNDLRIQPAIELIVRSDRFMNAVDDRIRPPHSFVLGGVRKIGLHRPAEGRQAVTPESAADWMAAMGQDLFQPPGVAGWTGGQVWLGTSAMIQRAAFADALGRGELADIGDKSELAFSLADSHLD